MFKNDPGPLANAGSIEFSDCRLDVSVSLGELPGTVLAPPSARSDTINFDMALTKSGFETEPAPLGSSAEKIASAPCF